MVGTLPVFTANEHSIKTLKRFKTYYFKNTNQERLTGLSLLNTHRYIIVELLKIVNKLAKQRQKLNLVILFLKASWSLIMLNVLIIKVFNIYVYGTLVRIHNLLSPL